MYTQPRRFNLVDERWIPLESGEHISLRDVFSHNFSGGLGASPVEKTALLKFFLAIAQAACTPATKRDWASMGPSAISYSCMKYLHTWHDAFWLFGERPFLQLPQADAASPRRLETLLPKYARCATGLLRKNREEMDDADKAMLVLVMCGFGLGGRRSDNTVVLTPGYQGKDNFNGTAAPGKPGSLLGSRGYVHHFLLGETLAHTLWFNMLTLEDIESSGHFPGGVGVPPWEAMPEGEVCARALRLRTSLMGRLLPMSKFCLLHDDHMHVTDGITREEAGEEWFDASIAVDTSGNGPAALWVSQDRRPWRNLVDILGFLMGEGSLECHGIRMFLGRALRHSSIIGFWAGGMGVNMRHGEQEASGPEALVESFLILPGKLVTPRWYEGIKKEMAELSRFEKKVYARGAAYGKAIGVDRDIAGQAAARRFWKLCDAVYPRLFQADLAGTRAALLRRVYESTLHMYSDAGIAGERHAAHLRKGKTSYPKACSA